MTKTVMVGGNAYQIGRLNALKQLHVARRLLGIMPAVLRAMELAGIEPGQKQDALNPDQQMAMLQAGADVLGKLPDDEVDYVVNTCLQACQRQMSGAQGWSPVMLGDGQLMFEDIKLPELLQLTWEVVQENLMGFFNAPSTSTTGGAPIPRVRRSSISQREKTTS